MGAKTREKKENKVIPPLTSAPPRPHFEVLSTKESQNSTLDLCLTEALIRQTIFKGIFRVGPYLPR